MKSRKRKYKDTDKKNSIANFMLTMGIVLSSIGIIILFIIIEIISCFIK